MRRGCISLGEIHCSGCQQAIPYSERYLLVEEEDGVEAEKGDTMCYCVECALQKGYATTTVEKGETILSFFP